MLQKTLLIGTLALAMTGCGKNLGNSIVQKVAVDVQTQPAGVMASLTATINPGGLILPTLDLPITGHSGAVIGDVRLDQQTISVNVNVSELAKLNLEDGTKLPGGHLLPIILPSGVVPLSIAVAGGKTRIYVASQGGNIMLGVAVVIQSSFQFPLDIFFPFQSGKDISGAGGVFTGTSQGLAVFAVKAAPATAPTVTTTSVAMNGLGTLAVPTALSSGKSNFKMRSYNHSNGDLYDTYDTTYNMGEVEVQ